MKNTPKVNEVLDDDALLKRYRKEILDLKKQLEEVSWNTLGSLYQLSLAILYKYYMTESKVKIKTQLAFAVH